MIGQVLGFLFLCTLSYIDVCFWTSEAGWPKLLLIGRSMLAMADTMMSFSLELVSLYFTEHFSLGSNQDAFITWRLNNLESILSFFFPSSALRYFLRQDMWGKIFDRKCVINFPLWHNSLSVGKHGLLGIIPENQHFTKDDLWNHKNDWSFFKHFTDWFTYDFWRFLKACFCLPPP